MYFNNKRYLLLFILICSMYCEAGTKKQDITSLISVIPSEISMNIASFLPAAEREKMFLINKKIFNDTYLLSKKHREQAFKNYLMYPYLSCFYKDITNHPDQFILFNEEENVLGPLLERAENKKIFYELLLKEANPRYFDVQDWCNFFRLKLLNEDEIRENEKNVGFIKTISIPEEEKTLLNEGSINKVLIIEVGNEIFDVNAIGDKIIKKTKQTIDHKDSIRIIFRHLEEKRLEGFNQNLTLYQNVIALGRNLFEKFQIKGVDVKIIDHTLLYYLKNAQENNYFVVKNVFESIPINECNIYIDIVNQGVTPIIDGEFRKMHNNIQLRPYNFDTRGAQQLITNIIYHEYDESAGRNQFDEKLFEYLCDNGYGLLIALNNVSDFYSDYSELEAANLMKKIKILQKHLSPFAVLKNGYTFLDTIFDTFIDDTYKDVAHLLIRDFFIPFMRDYGINVNKYIYHRNKTFLISLFNNDFLSEENLMSIIFIFISQGVDLFFTVNDKTILEHFFAAMGQGRNVIDNFVIFQNLLKNQIAIENDQYAVALDTGDSILHSYFKYANVINEHILDEIMKVKTFNINVKNRDNETTFESFIFYVFRVYRTINNERDQGAFLEEVGQIVDKFIEYGFDFRRQKTKNNKSLLSLKEVLTSNNFYHREQFDKKIWDKVEKLLSEKRYRW